MDMLPGSITVSYNIRRGGKKRQMLSDVVKTITPEKTPKDLIGTRLLSILAKHAKAVVREVTTRILELLRKVKASLIFLPKSSGRRDDLCQQS